MNIQAFPTKGERTRALIVDSAASLFWRKSFNGVSVDDIAAEAQVNKATIYRYFADKADLALAVTRHQGVLSLEHVFESSMTGNNEPDARLAAIYAKAHHVHSQSLTDNGDVLGCPILGLALELSFEMPQIREEAQRIFERVEAYLLEIAAQANALGRTRQLPEQLSATLMHLLHGAFASARVAANPQRILDAGHASLALLGYPETRITRLEQLA